MLLIKWSVVQDVHEPYVGAYDIKVKNLYSVSFGTENNTVKKANLISSLFNLDKIKIGIDVIRREGILTFIKKLRSFKKNLSPIGYSLVGEVLEIGNKVHTNIQRNDIVVCAGQYAMHAEIVSVPAGMVSKIKEQKVYSNLECYALSAVFAVPINAVRHILEIPHHTSLYHRKCLIVGGGIIGTFCGIYLKYLGVKNIEFFDKQNNVIADEWFERTKNINKYDMIFVCSNSVEGLDAIFDQIIRLPLNSWRNSVKYTQIYFRRKNGYNQVL